MTNDIVTKHFEYLISDEYNFFEDDTSEDYKDHAKVLEFIENKLYSLSKEDRVVFIHLLLERQSSFVNCSIGNGNKKYYDNIQSFLYPFSYVCALFKIDLKRITNNLSYNTFSFFDLDYKNSPAFSFSRIQNSSLDKNGSTILNMSQIVVLSKLLRQKDVLGSNLDNTTYSKIISLLSGYSENTIRQDYSKNTNEIINQKDKVDDIIKVLKDIIESLEKEKNTII